MMMNMIAAHRKRILQFYLAALWLVCIYRAATQSIVHDEALTWQLYLAGPSARMFDYFDANHHFLNTLLMRLTTSIFGFSGLAMRLPALAGAALYFAAVYRICVMEFETGVGSMLAAALLTLNPFLLDLMVAARGYGMALALLFWAIALLLPHLRNPKRDAPRELLMAGAAIGLSIAANLVFLIPVVVLIILTALLRRPPKPAADLELVAATTRGKKLKKQITVKEREESIPPFWRYFLPPAVGIAVLLFLLAPLDQATSAHFYVGTSTVAESLHNLANVSLVHGGPLREISITRFAADAIAFVVVPVAILAAAVIGWWLRNVLLLLASGLMLGSALVLAALHFIRDVPYPIDRTGVYFIALASLVLAGLADLRFSRPFPKTVVSVVSAIVLLLVICFAFEFNTRKFLLWEYDADTEDLADRLGQISASKPAGSVRIGCSWVLEPSLNFYRLTKHLDWMAPVQRQDLSPGFDDYLVTREDHASIARLGLKPVYEGKISSTTLATP